MLHWTYQTWAPEDDLQQGDVLGRTPQIGEVLREVFPNLGEANIAFLVTSQTCDLVRRSGGTCKSDYVTLATVRELEPYLPRLIEPLCGTGTTGVFDENRRDIGRQFIERLINQNEQGQGLFYLHPVADVPVLARPSIARLRVTLSLRREHYDTMRSARVARLDEHFAAKLGWLAGNLFSRVATRDLEDDVKSDLVRDYLNPGVWVNGSWLRDAVKNGENPTTTTATALAERYAPTPSDAKLEQLVQTESERRIQNWLRTRAWQEKAPIIEAGLLDQVKAINDDLVFTKDFSRILEKQYLRMRRTPDASQLSWNEILKKCVQRESEEVLLDDLVEFPAAVTQQIRELSEADIPDEELVEVAGKLASAIANKASRLLK